MSSIAGPPRTARQSQWKSRTLGGVRCLAVAALWTLAGPPLADPPDLSYSAPVQRVAEILEKIKANYVEPIDDTKLVTNAVNWVLHSLDPHSAYLDAQAYRDLYNDNRGDTAASAWKSRSGGPGEGDGGARGRPGGACRHAGGRRDRRCRRHQHPGESLEQVIQQVRGKRGTKVELGIERGGEAAPQLRLTRDLIIGRSVWVSLIDSGYAYVRLSQFQVHTPESLVEGPGRFFHQDDTRVAGIVLDLRDNPAGLLSAAVGVSAVFLPAGAPVVFTEGIAKDASMRLFARRDDYLRYGAVDHLRTVPEELKTLPMVVLVNGGSASAARSSPVLCRTISGPRCWAPTSTKGSVQVVIPFGDGTGMKLTTAYYHTPSGRVIQGKGVMPDVVVEGQPLREAQAAPGVRAVALENPRSEATEHELAAECTPPAVASPDAAVSTGSQPAKSAVPGAGVRPDAGGVDCQLERALEVLRSRLAITRS